MAPRGLQDAPRAKYREGLDIDSSRRPRRRVCLLRRFLRRRRLARAASTPVTRAGHRCASCLPPANFPHPPSPPSSHVPVHPPPSSLLLPRFSSPSRAPLLHGVPHQSLTCSIRGWLSYAHCLSILMQRKLTDRSRSTIFFARVAVLGWAGGDSRSLNNSQDLLAGAAHRRLRMQLRKE